MSFQPTLARLPLAVVRVHATNARLEVIVEGFLVLVPVPDTPVRKPVAAAMKRAANQAAVANNRSRQSYLQAAYQLL